LIEILFELFSGGTWSEWGEFSGCSKTCGTGIKSRTRFCYGGECPGDAQQTVQCYSKECTSGELYSMLNSYFLRSKKIDNISWLCLG